ncbi:hypothetical protein EDD15DRAFT_2457238 [Pisolithus albus]|nr:hypothetical protein EDD15DRAFT_2457238 [Pisolithus albus]
MTKPDNWTKNNIDPDELKYIGSESATRAEGTFKYRSTRHTTSFWIALAYMIVKGTAQHMPPTIRPSEVTAIDSLGEDLAQSLAITPRSPQTTPASASRSCTSMPCSRSEPSSKAAQPSPPTLTRTYRTQSSMPTRHTEMSPIIYNHVRTLRGIIASHYCPTATTDVQDLARPLGNLAALYLASHGYDQEDVGTIIRTHSRARNDEDFVMSLARQGMAVSEVHRLSEATPAEIDEIGGGYTVQLVSIKKVTAVSAATSAIDRYRIIMSDGVHFIQAMLATQLNDLVSNEEI